MGNQLCAPWSSLLRRRPSRAAPSRRQLHSQQHTGEVSQQPCTGPVDASRLTQENAELRRRIQDLEAGVARAPATPTAGSLPPRPPPPAAPAAPTPAPVTRCPPPPPPPAPACGAVRRPLPPGLKAKPELPKRQLRNLHWTTIPVHEIADTIWMKLNNSDPELDTALFQQAFATVAQKPSSLASDQKPKSAPVRAERVKLIDSKRSHNVELSLARFKMSPGEIRDAVLYLDQARLSAHQVSTLWKCCPTQPEIALVGGHSA
ncbi:unnamed protein product (mitochondrion) [Plasmodiophora brassicae]|uniref:FH2 domain-containing protein n=1 Tax=Plasmodiophora brassicae TaxID=37360 RepID=A0A3P3YIZ3_PLABS|nr:unnamed protein product [Plasmodiophora brassicae]